MTVWWLAAIPILLILALTVWNVVAWPHIRETAQTWPGAVSVLIPARDEEHNIAACLTTVLRQGETVSEVLVYDDHSTDATPQIVAGYAGAVRLLEPVELAAGWCGKTFACAQLAAQARGEWLLFLDADARLTDGAVARLVAEATSRQVTLLSAWPQLVQASFWEKTLMPLLNFVVFTLFPAPLSLLRPDASLGLAHGVCLLVRRDEYFAVGGHHAVRAEIFEDRRLAQHWRAQGQRGLCLDGQTVVRVRMYNSRGEIWRGFQKNFFPAFRSAAVFWVFLLFHALVFWVPFLLPRAWLVALGVLFVRALLAARFRTAWWSVFLHPLAEGMLLALGLSSWWRCRSGQGVEWKGRQYKTGKG